MSKYKTDADRAEEAETLMATLAIVRLAELELDGKLAVLPPEFASFLIAPHADLLLVPSTTTNGSDRSKVTAAMRLTRCNALIVRISRLAGGAQKVLMDVGLDGRECVWHQEYRACLLDGVLHCAPDHDASGPIFRLTSKGLVASAPADVLQHASFKQGEDRNVR